jgi:phage/plasmid-like protein (TIGR03299 family)
MTHGITESDQMFYAKENGPPWHIDDTKDRSVAVDEAPTSAEAIEAAGLSWEVQVKQAFYSLHGRQKKADECGIVVRSDTGEALAHVGMGYSPIQNAEMFSFMDELVGSGDLRYETAGSLWGGRKVWMLARVPEEIEVGGDRCFPYLLAHSVHDGHGACKILPSVVRVVCNNTLAAALFSHDSEIRKMTVSIAHIGNVRDKLSKAREVLGLGLESFKRFQQVGEIMTATDGLPLVDDLVAKLFPQRNDEAEEPPTEAVMKRREAFTDILAAESAGRRPTAYDLLNAVSGYADHVRAVDNVRGGINSKEQARMESVFFGGARRWKESALDLILSMAKIYEQLEEAKIPVRIKRAA